MGCSQRAEWALPRLEVGVYLVREDGGVERLLKYRFGCVSAQTEAAAQEFTVAVVDQDNVLNQGKKA